MVMDSVIEFDSKVTEKDLLRFKFYHFTAEPVRITVFLNDFLRA